MLYQIQCRYYYIIEYNRQTRKYDILRTDNPNLLEYYNDSQ
jgi:hypothetical protein